MINFIKKINFLFKRTPIIIIVGEKKPLGARVVSQILRNKFKVKKAKGKKIPFFRKEKEIFVLGEDLKNDKIFKDVIFLIKKSSLPILVVSSSINNEKRVFDLIKNFPEHGFIIISNESGVVRRARTESIARLLIYGTEPGVDFQITDINLGEKETNFKIKHEGDIIPFWLKGSLNKEEIYVYVGSIIAGFLNNLNLVEISQIFKKKI